MDLDDVMTRLERRLAAAGVNRAATLAEPDATIRPPHLTAAQTASDSSDTTTGPFLPSITLAEADRGEPSAPADADLLVSSLLGQGGMGVVHVASQRSLDRDVAVKRPTTDVGGPPLIAEARTMARVEHPNVLPVHALGRDRDGRPVLVMKRIEGASLRDLLRDTSHALWPLLDARWGDRQSACLGILADVADALGHAHARGIVHRDVKPENVMVGEFGEVYLLDWGIAQHIEPVDGSDEARSAIAGTPGYMAPEMVLEPASCDARTDVYLLGATLHQILTGTLRHRGATYAATLFSAMESSPVMYGEDVPDDLAALANAATSKERRDRPESAAAFRRALLLHERHKEAHELVRAAREALRPLRDGGVDVGDPSAAPLLFEARSLITAAARAHPTSALVTAARAECIALAIERDVAIESPSSARVLLADLPAPRPDLEEAIAALEERLARAKASEELLRRERAEADTSSASRIRSVILTASFVPMLLVAVAYSAGLLGAAGSVSPTEIAWTNVGALVLLSLGVIVARRRLLATRANRTLTWYALGGVAVVSGVGFAAVALGAPTHAGLAYTHLVVVAYTLAGAVTFSRALASIAFCSAVFAMLFIGLPEATGILSPLGLLGVIATSLASVLAHAARARAAHPPA